MCIFQFTLSIVNRSDMTVSLEDSKIKKRMLSSLKDCCTKSNVHQRLGCIHEPLFDIELDHVKQQDSDSRILIPFPVFLHQYQVSIMIRHRMALLLLLSRYLRAEESGYHEGWKGCEHGNKSTPSLPRPPWASGASCPLEYG